MHHVVVGCGYTGGRVLEALGAKHAIGFRRRPTGASEPSVTPLDLDFEPASALSLPPHYAVLYTVPPDRSAETDPRLVRLLRLLDPLPRRIVYLSTSGVYGDCGGRLVDEDAPPRPATPRAGRRLAAERQLQAWAEDRDVAWVILRVPAIYGPGRLGIDGIRSGAPVIREAEAQPGNRIHVDDLVSCCVQALAAGRPPGIYNVGDGNHRSHTWFTACVANLSGLPAPPAVSRAEAERSFSPARLSFLGESRRLDTRKMRQLLGVEPRYSDAENGIRAALAAEGLPAG